MKKFLLLWVLGLAILTGCAQQGLSQSELFEKKKECKSYQTQIEEKENKNLVNTYGSGKKQTLTYQVLDVFYSKKANTCLYNIRFIDMQDWVVKNSRVELKDYLSSKILGYNFLVCETNSGCLQKDPESIKKSNLEYRKLIKELE